MQYRRVVSKALFGTVQETDRVGVELQRPFRRILHYGAGL
jgi:hypothetical protein